MAAGRRLTRRALFRPSRPNASTSTSPGRSATRARGNVAATRPKPDFEKAERCYAQALAIARRVGAKSLELRAAKGLARVWHRQGKAREARDLLGPVLAWFTEGFDTLDLIEARDVLQRL